MNMSTNTTSSDPVVSRSVDIDEGLLRTDDGDEDAEDDDDLMASELCATGNGNGKCFILHYV